MKMVDFPVLYKYTQKGQVQQWQIVVDGSSFYTIEGIVGGKMTTSPPTICLPKNVGRSNESSSTEQAELEAKARHKKKLDAHYNEVLTTARSFKEPMLAKKFEDYPPTFKERTFIQPKLDGLRGMNENNTLNSRNGKPYSCPHLFQDSASFDGELYNHALKDDFNKIVSLCKKTKPTPEDLAETEEKVQYWTYDFPDHEGVFSERYQALLDQVALEHERKSPWIHHFVVVPTYEVFSMEDIQNYHDQFLAEGYEGSIVRTDTGFYEGKRTKQLLKLKDFQDDEFEIVSVEEGVGTRAGMAGYLVVKLEDGRTCKSNIKGGFDFYKELLIDREKLVGKTATIQYFSRTPDGFLRFPVAIKINREEYE
jgi:ATP-dependent DNA ligase